MTTTRSVNPGSYDNRCEMSPVKSRSTQMTVAYVVTIDQHPGLFFGLLFGVALKLNSRFVHSSRECGRGIRASIGEARGEGL